MEVEFYNRDDDPLDSDELSSSSDKWYAMASKNWSETEKKNYWQDRKNKIDSYFMGGFGGFGTSMVALAVGAGPFTAAALGGLSCYSLVKITYPESLTPTWCGEV